MNATKLVILGRDGILNAYREGHVTGPEEWSALPGALEALSRINHAGWHVVVATNQAGIGRGMIEMAAVNAVHAHMNQQMMAHGARIDAAFFCPHTPEDQCECRKPKPGMLQEIGRRYGVDLANVPFASDTLRDLLAAQAAGCEPHLVLTGRAEGLSDGQLQAIVQQVPATRVHDDLSAFADFLLRRGNVEDSASGNLS
jgi:D-glycero-D-manno-heptose 1,7-bisphosphate phosphatase